MLGFIREFEAARWPIPSLTALKADSIRVDAHAQTWQAQPRSASALPSMQPRSDHRCSLSMVSAPHRSRTRPPPRLIRPGHSEPSRAEGADAARSSFSFETQAWRQNADLNEAAGNLESADSESRLRAGLSRLTYAGMAVAYSSQEVCASIDAEAPSTRAAEAAKDYFMGGCLRGQAVAPRRHALPGSGAFSAAAARDARQTVLMAFHLHSRGSSSG